MPAPTGNALIGQSGGPTCVINQSLVGLVEAAAGSQRVKNVWGAVHGIAGVLKEDLIDLGRESKATLEAVARTPCAARPVKLIAVSVSRRRRGHAGTGRVQALGGAP